METYPTTLPGVSTAFRAGSTFANVRSEFETGRTRQRQRFKHVVAEYRVTWEFNQLQFEVFEAWHRIKLNNGNDWFTMSLPTAQGMQSVEARFIEGDFDWHHEDVMNWKVSAQLEVFGSYGMTEAELDAALAG